MQETILMKHFNSILIQFNQHYRKITIEQIFKLIKTINDVKK